MYVPPVIGATTYATAPSRAYDEVANAPLSAPASATDPRSLVGRIVATVHAIAGEFQRQANPSGTIQLTVGMVDRVSDERQLALQEARSRASGTGIAHAVFRDANGHFFVAPVQFAGGAPFNWVDHPVAMRSMSIQPANGVLTAVVGSSNWVDFAN